MTKVLKLFFLIIFLLINTSNVFSFQDVSYRIVRTSNQPVESHSFVIPGPGDNGIGRILFDINPSDQATINSIVGNTPQNVLSREEIQAVVIPTLTAALAAWEKVGSGEQMSTDDRKDIKVHADGIAVYAAMNALWAMAKNYNIVFVTESSEGGSDNSFDIPMGTIIGSEGQISPETCEEVLGHLPKDIGEVLEIIEKCNVHKNNSPKYIVAINYDPVENTNAHVDGKSDSYSLMGATFYPVQEEGPPDDVLNSQLHFVPDTGVYLAGYSWNSSDVTDIDVWDRPSEVAEKLRVSGAAFLGGRSRHDSIFDELEPMLGRENLNTPKDGDAILRVFSSAMGELPEAGSLFTAGASGTSEAAIAYKTAMMFNDGHTVLTYVPKDVTDLTKFLQSNRGASSKFSSEQIDMLERLNITSSHYAQQFSSDRAVLPEGAFNVMTFVPITGASSGVLGDKMQQLLPGINVDGVNNPNDTRDRKEDTGVSTQALIAVRFPEDQDGSLFTVDMPFSTPNLQVFQNYIENVLSPQVARMVVDPQERKSVIPVVEPEK